STARDTPGAPRTSPRTSIIWQFSATSLRAVRAMSQDGGDTDAQGVGATDVPGRRWHVLPQARDDGQARAARGLLFECSPALLGQGEGGCSGQTEGDREHREGEDLPPCSPPSWC